MSGTVKRNKFIPIFVIGLVLLLAVVVMVSCQPKADRQGMGTAQQNTHRDGSNDTPVESLNTIGGEVTLLSEQLTDLAIQQKNEFEEKLKGEREQWNTKLSEVEEKLSAGTEVLFNKLESSVNNLSNELKNSQKTHPVQPGYQVGQAPSRQGKMRSDGKLWISPAGGTGQLNPNIVKVAANAPASNVSLFDQALNAIEGITPGSISGPGVSLDGSVSGAASTSAASNNGAPAETVIKGVTIPSNATLIGSTLFTALIGRVPLRGVVHDPVPFKVITGAENLASNGIYIPGLKETIWSGIANGDGTLKCARGEIQSVTFVFQDGRIVTHPEKRSDSNKPIGWITNDRGFPCIPGQFVSNAPEVMTQLFFAGAAAGAGDAFAESELTTITGDRGDVTQVLTGSGSKYVLGQGLGSGFSEWARYIAERAKDKFDAVVVSPGETIAINVNEMIPIDYHSGARKVSYLAPQTVTNGGLD